MVGANSLLRFTPKDAAHEWESGGGVFEVNLVDNVESLAFKVQTL
jgi:hypothetical protein